MQQFIFKFLTQILKNTEFKTLKNKFLLQSDFCKQVFSCCEVKIKTFSLMSIGKGLWWWGWRVQWVKVKEKILTVRGLLNIYGFNSFPEINHIHTHKIMSEKPLKVYFFKVLKFLMAMLSCFCYHHSYR